MIVEEVSEVRGKSSTPDIGDIRKTLDVMCLPGCVYELRVVKTKCGTVGGWYDDLDTLADDAWWLTKGGYKVANKWGKQDALEPVPSVYVTLNPVNADLLARANNRVKVLEEKEATKDDGVIRITRLPIDFDPVRMTGISSTEEEHDLALGRARQVREYLSGHGFPAPVVGDSGNGGHLVYGLDMPNDESVSLVKDFIHAVAGKFGDDKVDVDIKVFNPSRIWTLYGTMKRKGDSTNARPHRLSRIIENPGELIPVSPEVMALVISELSPGPSSSNNSKDVGDTTPPDFTDAVKEAVGAPPDDWFKVYQGNLRTLDVVALWRSRGLGIEEVKPGDYKCQCPRQDRHSDDKPGGTVLFKSPDKFPVYICERTGCRGDFGKQRGGIKTVLEWFGKDAVDGFCAAKFGAGTGSEKSDKVDVSEGMVSLVKSRAELFRDDDGTPYARVVVDGHRETMPVGSKSFTTWMAGLWYDTTGKPPKSEPMTQAVKVIEYLAGKAPRRSVYLRWAWVDGKVYLDLGNDRWEIVEVSADGWKIVDDAPVVFRRNSNTGSYPNPARGGSLDRLRRFFTGDDDAYLLWLGSILTATTSGSYFTTCLHGEQGSAKSWACRFARRLVDPVGKVELTSLPKVVDDNVIKVIQQRHAVCFDNVSSISADMSDFLCTLATGGGQQVRALYTDDELKSYDYKRPVWLNGIPDFNERPDLADRAITIQMPALTTRANEDDLEADWRDELPGILGGLLDTIAAGLGRVSATPPAGQFRMSKAVQWVDACMGDSRFSTLYAENREASAEVGLDSSPVASLLISYLAAPKPFGAGGAYRGTATDLLKSLNDFADLKRIERHKHFPVLSNRFSGELRRIAPGLRDLRDIHVVHTTVKGTVVWDIKTVKPEIQDAPSDDVGMTDTIKSASNPFGHSGIGTDSPVISVPPAPKPTPKQNSKPAPTPEELHERRQRFAREDAERYRNRYTNGCLLPPLAPIKWVNVDGVLTGVSG